MSNDDSSRGPAETPFGRWVKERREELGLSHAQLAELSGVCVAQVYNIETGRTKNPRPSTREQLERALAGATDVGTRGRVVTIPKEPSELSRREGTELSCCFCKRSLSATKSIAWLTDDQYPAVCNYCVDDLNAVFARAERRDRYDGKARLRLVPKVIATTQAPQAARGDDRSS